MFKRHKKLSAVSSIWLIIVAFLAIHIFAGPVHSYICGLELVVEYNGCTDFCDLSECADLDSATAENTSSKNTVSEESSSEEDLISFHFTSFRDRFFLFGNRNRHLLSENHTAPHIEFQSPPPESYLI